MPPKRGHWRPFGRSCVIVFGRPVLIFSNQMMGIVAWPCYLCLNSLFPVSFRVALHFYFLQSFLLKVVSHDNDGSTSIVRSIPCAAGSSNEVCMVEVSSLVLLEYRTTSGQLRIAGVEFLTGILARHVRDTHRLQHQPSCGYQRESSAVI